jgi:hypothetical protein
MTVTDRAMTGGRVTDGFVTVLGQPVAVPVQVRSATMVGGTFTVPATAAQKLIDYSGLRVAKVAGTLGICMVSGVQYTDNDLGPYNEIALAIVVHPPDGPPTTPTSLLSGNVTTFIHRLPVNQQFTCAAGRDIWGFPKWVADISFQERPGRTDVVMLDDGEHAATLSVRTRGLIPVPANEMEMSCFSFRDGVLRRTPWMMRLARARMGPGGAEVQVGERNQLADDLRSLGFPKKGLFAQSVGHLECTFGSAEVVSRG